MTICYGEMVDRDLVVLKVLNLVDMLLARRLKNMFLKDLLDEVEVWVI